MHAESRLAGFQEDGEMNGLCIDDIDEVRLHSLPCSFPRGVGGAVQRRVLSMLTRHMSENASKTC